MKGHNLSSLKKDLSLVDWETLFTDNTNDVNSQFDIFHDLLLNKLDDHCPLKSFDLSSKKIIREPWLTKGLLKSQTKQRLLYKNFLLEKSEINELKYKTYRNTLQKIKRKEKQTYYNKHCLQFKSNSKKLWKIINVLTKKQMIKVV